MGGKGRRCGGPGEALRAGLQVWWESQDPAWSGRGDGWDSYADGRTIRSMDHHYFPAKVSMIHCMQDQLRYPVSMPERATLSIYTLIDFFPRVDMTAWRCKLCPTPPDPSGTPITESPRWTVASDEGWAQREARMHLAELHDIRFDQQD